MKPLKPSLREKRRYILFSIIGNKNFSQIKNEIIKTIKKFMGDFYFGIANIKIIDYGDKYFILRVNRKFVNFLRSSIIFVKDCAIRSVSCSGTIKKIKKVMKDGYL